MFDHNSIIDMLFSGVIQIAQKVATQHGACHALTAFWKNAMGTYHENGKVRIIIQPMIIPTQYFQHKYRKAAHMKVAAAGGVLGEKIMMDSTFNSLVNDQGNIYVKYLKN